MTEKELEAKVDFLSSAKCNHTPHKYIDITGDLIQGTLLSKIMYWFAEDKNGQKKVRIFKDGYFWIAKQRKNWWEEIRISERQYDKAIKSLEESGFVVLAKYKFNSMPTIHIRPNYDNIDDAVKKWENELKEEIVKENESELRKSENGNNTKCNSQGNDIKCKSGITQENNLLTDITSNDYLNKDYTTDITKADTLSNDNAKVDTSFSKKSLPTKERKNTKSDLKVLEADMVKRFRDIGSQYDVNEIALKNIFNAFKRYLEKYTERTGKVHPILKDETLKRVFITLATISDPTYRHFENVAEYEPDSDGVSYLDEIVDEFFKIDHGAETDYHITHFANSEYLEKLANHIVEW